MGDSLFDNVPAETPLSPEEAIIRRHRKEKKDLQGQIVAMKKSAGKADKKKKKELADEIAKLESDLEARHKQELDVFLPKRIQISETIPEGDESHAHHDAAEVDAKPNSASDNGGAEVVGTPKLSKAQKRREKKSAQEIERQKRIDDETKVLTENSASKKEEDELALILSQLKLAVHEIPADGNCLYAAVSHQLERCGEAISPQDLRARTSSFLVKHKDEFINYLEDDCARESQKGFEKYCEAINDPSVWGGHVELQVLSKVLSKPIHIIQADGPKLEFGEGNTPLKITYHKHKLALGAHYNSAVPKPS